MKEGLEHLIAQDGGMGGEGVVEAAVAITLAVACLLRIYHMCLFSLPHVPL